MLTLIDRARDSDNAFIDDSAVVDDDALSGSELCVNNRNVNLIY